ncbi:MAG: hypothetical protein CR994_02425 [Maribacter sp.]|nr:MAG: hypothetical protein CR994_02425 [Maribacter sp.]
MAQTWSVPAKIQPKTIVPIHGLDTINAFYKSGLSFFMELQCQITFMNNNFVFLNRYCSLSMIMKYIIEPKHWEYNNF